ncbi:MAG: permease-like cell division protein FtsX, partial [Verrucomicrobiota bacterium]
MKGKRSLLWIDWRLAGGAVGRQSLTRSAFLCVLAAGLLVLLLSNGIGRFLSSRYAITAVLRDSVSAEDAQGLARKAAGLPPVASAVYRDSAEAWKELLQAYPGLESLPDPVGNPLPGYIQIRIRKDRFTASDLDLVVSALRPLPAVEQVLTGEDALPGLLRADRYAALLVWAVFGAFAAGFSLVCVLQEQVRGLASGGGFRYLLEQGVPGRRLALSRAAGAAIWNLLLAGCATGAAGVALSFSLGRFAVLRTVIGPPEDLLTPPVAAG